MGTSNSSPVRFIGQGPLPEFDYSQQPLPDNIRVLLWMLDGAERRHHLARSWRVPLRTFTSKWRVVRSRLPCRERGTP
jgi:hypothetical protein